MERFVLHSLTFHLILIKLLQLLLTPLSPPLLQILTMFEENYPEGLKRVFLIKGTSADLWLSVCLT